MMFCSCRQKIKHSLRHYYLFDLFYLQSEDRVNYSEPESYHGQTHMLHNHGHDSQMQFYCSSEILFELSVSSWWRTKHRICDHWWETFLLQGMALRARYNITYRFQLTSILKACEKICRKWQMLRSNYAGKSPAMLILWCRFSSR